MLAFAALRRSRWKRIHARGSEISRASARAAHRSRSFNRLRDRTRSSVTENCKVKLARARFPIYFTRARKQGALLVLPSRSSSRRNSFHPVVERYRLPTSTTRAFTAHPEEPTSGSSPANFAPESDNYRWHAVAPLPSFP